MGIELKNINKKFGNFEALNNVSLKFQKGKLTALLGPSGCGKTTLLRTIAGLEHTDSGQIFLNETDASLTHIKQRQVGFVFQHYALFKHMTVFENIAFSLRIKNKKERPSENQIRNRVFDLLKLIQLDLLSHHFPSQLSGGQRQRVALARALASDPKVLLLDEPFGALDAKVRKELRRWLRNIHDELQMTTVFVTHDQEEALEISDQVILMNNGRIEQIGTPSEIYNEPASEFVYSFLGNVNIFKGKIFGDVLHVGNHRLKTTNKSSVNDGSNVFAFVRPHEFEIFPFDNGNSDIKARIERILPFGPLVKIEVSRLDDIYQADFPHHFEVEITKNELEQKQIKEGSKIFLRPSKLQLFKNNFE